MQPPFTRFLFFSFSFSPHKVDLLCSHWFVETDWVKLLFREKWETPQTGEVI